MLFRSRAHHSKSIIVREFFPPTFLSELLKRLKSGYIPEVDSARFSDQMPQVIWMTKPKKVLDKEYQQIVVDITDKYKKEIADCEAERLVKLEGERQRILLERENKALEVRYYKMTQGVNMDNKNATLANPKSANSHTMKNIRAVKKLKVLIHFLYSPQRVTEKSIDIAAHVMSGRNFPMDLQREHNIFLLNPRLKLKDKDDCSYSVYQLLNAEQAHKLVDLIIYHCKRYRLDTMDELAMRLLADNFPERGELA